MTAVAVQVRRGVRLPGERRHLRAVSTGAPTWAELASCLDWLRRRGWPALELLSRTIEGEDAWRAWLLTADRRVVLAVRDALVASRRPAS
jgi:hypothetical protein